MNINASHLAALLLDYSDAPSDAVANRQAAAIRARMLRGAYAHELRGLRMRGDTADMPAQLCSFAARIGAAVRVSA